MLLFVRSVMFAVRCYVSAVVIVDCCLLVGVRCALSFAACCLSLRLLFVVCCVSLFVVRCASCVACCLVSIVVCGSLFVIGWLCVFGCLLLIGCRLLFNAVSWRWFVVRCVLFVCGLLMFACY